MSTTEHPNNPVVLACIDGASFSTAVCDFATWIANQTGAPLKLLHNIEHEQTAAVSDLTGAIGLGSQEELLEELTEVEQQHNRLRLKKGKLMLEAARERAQKAGVEEPSLCLRHGGVNETLVELEEQIRVLVIGLRGEQHEHTAKGVGTQLEAIIRSLHKPILVVNKEFSAPKRIMLAYDGSEASRKALQMVAASPLFKGIPCHLVHVGPENDSTQSLLSEAASKLETAGLEITVARLEGELDKTLCQYQADQQIDLTLMGAFSHHRIRDFLLGSFTAKMLAETQQPLLLLR